MIPKVLEEILEDFKELTNERERKELILYYEQDFKTVPEHIAKPPFDESHKVKDCMTTVYVWSEKQGTHLKFYYYIDTQGLGARAMSVIFDIVFAEISIQEILEIPENIILTIMGEGLSMGRRRGLSSFLSTIKEHAKKALTK